MSDPKRTAPRTYRAMFVVLLLAAAAAFGFYFRQKLQGIEPKPEPLANLPANASIVLYVRTASVLSSEALRILVRRELIEEPLERLRTRCGFDPTANVEDVTLFVTGDDTRSLDALGLLARGDLGDRRLLECMRKAAREEGVGQLRYYQLDGVPAAAPAEGEQRALFLGRRAVALGREDTLRALIGVMRDDRPSARGDESLRRLWERVASGRDVVLVGKVPDDWQQQLRDLSGQAADPELQALVSQLSGVALAATFTSGLEITVLVEGRDAAVASAIAGRVRGAVDQLTQNMLISMTPIGPVVRSIRTDLQERVFQVTISLPRDRLENMFEFATAWQQNNARMQARDAAEPGTAPAPTLVPAPTGTPSIGPAPASP